MSPSAALPAASAEAKSAMADAQAELRSVLLAQLNTVAPAPVATSLAASLAQRQADAAAAASVAAVATSSVAADTTPSPGTAGRCRSRVDEQVAAKMAELRAARRAAQNSSAQLGADPLPPPPPSPRPPPSPAASPVRYPGASPARRYAWPAYPADPPQGGSLLYTQPASELDGTVPSSHWRIPRFAASGAQYTNVAMSPSLTSSIPAFDAAIMASSPQHH